MQKVLITSVLTQETLDATLVSSEHPTGKAILFLHGWRSKEDGYIPRAKALADLGYTCLAFSFRGHGNSGGDIHTLTRQDFLNDAVAAYDLLKSQPGVEEGTIGVVGASFGGYLATLLTKKRPVRWLVLRAPANYPDKGFENEFHFDYSREGREAELVQNWRLKKLAYGETRALQALHAYPDKVLLVESGDDMVIPHQAVQNYVDAVSDKTKLTYVVMEGADHAIREGQYGQEFIKILVDWFTKFS